MRNFFVKIVSGIVGIWVAVNFVPGVDFTGSWKALLIAGFFMGVVNAFLKPILKIITLPVRILTLGIFGFIINIAMVWLIDIFFTELVITGIIPLLWTTLTVWGLGFILGLIFKR